MANSTGYEVLVPELTVHRQVGELTDPVSGTVTGIQQGQGKTYFAGQVIPADAISPILKDALENEDHPSHEYASKRIRQASSDADGSAASEPFPGYDDMDVDDVVSAMRSLPSATITRIKQYEAANEGRTEIADFSIGFGVDPDAHQEGRVGGDLNEDRDDSKAVARIKTRSVPEDGPVERGEGITGTGDPQVEPGTAAAEEEGEGKPRSSRNRRGRRERPAGKAKAAAAKKNQSGSEGEESEEPSGDGDE